MHHLNNVNKALQILEQNNVSVKFQLKICCFLLAQHDSLYLYLPYKLRHVQTVQVIFRRCVFLRSMKVVHVMPNFCILIFSCYC